MAAIPAYWRREGTELLAGKLTASVATKGGISTATVSGACPSCADNVNFSQVLDVVTGESLGPLGVRARPTVPSDYVPLTVSCYCTGQHPGRPDGIGHGCGINFRVDVLRDT